MEWWHYKTDDPIVVLIVWWIQNIAAVCQAIGLLGAAVGLILNYLQLRANNRQKAAEFIFSLNNNIYQNDEMNKMYFKIEADKFYYTKGKFRSTTEQIALNNLLDHFESIAKLYLLSNFKLKDLEYLAYYYLVVFENDSVQSYIKYLGKISTERNYSAKPYADFNKVGNKLKEKFRLEEQDNASDYKSKPQQK